MINVICYVGVVASICNSLGIPHIIAHWQPEDLVPAAALKHHAHTRNFFPDPSLFARALADVIVDNEWKGFSVIYENEDSLQRLQDVLQILEPNGQPVTVRQLRAGADHQTLLKELYQAGETRIVLDGSPAKVTEVLQQAAGVKMMQEYQSYMITSLDAHMLNFAEMNFTGAQPVRANISTVRLMDPESVWVHTAVHDWQQGAIRWNLTTYPSPDKVLVSAGRDFV